MDIATPQKKYIKEQSLTYSCQYHVIFCPKYRRKVFEGELALRLKELLVEGQSKYSYEIIEMEVMPDHVHLLLSVNPQDGIAMVVARIKGWTASVLRKEFPQLKKRLPSLWTRSKFISTVGVVSLETVKQYIIEQKGK